MLLLAHEPERYFARYVWMRQNHDDLLSPCVSEIHAKNYAMTRESNNFLSAMICSPGVLMTLRTSILVTNPAIILHSFLFPSWLPVIV